MSKKLVIESCAGCPYLSHAGGFGEVAYIPRCAKETKTLPWTPSVSTAKGGGVRVTAVLTEGIPEWCPLEDNAIVTGSGEGQ